MSDDRIVALIGNPKPASRTRDAAERLARGLGEEISVIELSQFGAALLDWTNAEVQAAVDTVAKADLLIVASPTFKATYTGLLKLFLERFPGQNGLAGVVGVPVMLGAAPMHAMAPETHLKPLLVELGASCPAPSLYLIDSTYGTDGSLESWLKSWRAVVLRGVGGRERS
ncbi:NAD(P)H-dependent oxidoreductase [Nonomuraea sp. NBC_00507]|uniref:NADPH-dependent FMN reductase n=1 Tax=unclassified Nonomuraea TaxID=2593643 RepID=UPI00273CDF49|nr:MULTISPECIES: NAD(P)H-dependent oxidoreductase [unclassified Nonomuraea]MDP4503244.1 NAD(P)H-dependent oxidoreductase [Nonomuraea sp. G32]